MFKGHVTRFKTMFEDQLRFSVVTEFETLPKKLFYTIRETEDHLFKMSELENMYVQDQEYIEKELDTVGEVRRKINEQFVEYQQKMFELAAEHQQRDDDGANDDGGDGVTGQANENLPNLANSAKKFHRKPPELDGNADLKGLEAWQENFMDYHMLSGMENDKNNVQMA